MHTISRCLLLITLMFICFFVSTTAHAADIAFDKIVADLDVMDAVVIVGPDGNLLLNKGSQDRVRRGDLWTIHAKGKIIKDPVSGEALGRFDEIIGVVKVIRADDRFCQIKSVHPTDATYKAGLLAKRFDQIKSVFQDSSGAYFDVYEKLRARLPNLNWQAYQMVDPNKVVAAPTDAVVFSARKDRLVLWSGGEIAGVYENGIPVDTVKEPGQPLSLNETTPQRSTMPSRVPTPAPPVVHEKPAVKETAQPVIKPVPGLMTPGLTAKIANLQYRSVGSLDTIAYHLDIMKDNSEAAYFVYLSDEGLFVQSVLGAGASYTYRYEGFGRVAGISIGPAGMIAMNIFNQSEWAMASLLLHFSGSGFEILDSDINYILSYVDVDDDGQEELIGQNFDNEDFFGTGIYELFLKDGQLHRARALDLPVGFRIFGSFWADFDDDHVVENGFYNSVRRLSVYSQGKEVWRSTDPFGGSVKGVAIENIESEGATSRNEIVWSPPAVVPYENGKFVALAYNDPSLLNVIGMRPRKGEVGILYKNDGRFFLRLLDAGFEGPIQSVFVHQNELYCSVVEGGLFSGQSGKTHVIAFSLEVLKKALE